jgi:hypothetical protein
LTPIWTKDEIKANIDDCVKGLKLLAATSLQSYTIGDKSFTRASIAELRKLLDFWRNELAVLEAIEGGKSNIQKIRTRFID